MLCRWLCRKRTHDDDDDAGDGAETPAPAVANGKVGGLGPLANGAAVLVNGSAAADEEDIVPDDGSGAAAAATPGAARRRLEEQQSEAQPAGRGLTVRVEVHSSSSGAGSEENLSSSDLSSERSGGGGGGGGRPREAEAEDDQQQQQQHEYEDIYQVRREAGDSGSHSRAASTGSGGSAPPPAPASTDLEAIKILEELIQKLDSEPQAASVPSSESGVSSGSPSDLEEGVSADKQAPRPPKKHSTLPHPHPARALKRVVSEPGGAVLPPPPPPPPPEKQQQPASVPSSPLPPSHTPSPPPPRTPSPAPPPAEEVPTSPPPLEESDPERVEGKSDPAPRGEQEEHSKLAHNLVNKQMVLPFVPPKFPSQAAAGSDSLIKPSEYLRSLGPAHHQQQQQLQQATLPPPPPQAHEGLPPQAPEGLLPPPPPPPPPPQQQEDDQATLKLQQPLGTISVQELRGVQLRRTEKAPASKTMSAPPPLGSRTLAGGEQPFQTQKEDLIAELKMSKDITGIKKLKVERAKVEEQQEKELFTEITKTLTVNSFVEKVPDKDGTGNPIPPWKRQMLAKKAADKARKELEEQLQKEAEQKRLQSIPPWKRQLLAKKEETNVNKPVAHAPKAADDKKVTVVKAMVAVVKPEVVEPPLAEENKENSTPPQRDSDDSDPDPQPIMPWRAQLRKTNSKLSLLE